MAGLFGAEIHLGLTQRCLAFTAGAVISAICIYSAIRGVKIGRKLAIELITGDLKCPSTGDAELDSVRSGVLNALRWSLQCKDNGQKVKLIADLFRTSADHFSQMLTRKIAWLRDGRLSEQQQLLVRLECIAYLLFQAKRVLTSCCRDDWEIEFVENIVHTLIIQPVVGTYRLYYSAKATKEMTHNWFLRAEQYAKLQSSESAVWNCEHAFLNNVRTIVLEKTFGNGLRIAPVGAFEGVSDYVALANNHALYIFLNCFHAILSDEQGLLCSPERFADRIKEAIINSKAVDCRPDDARMVATSLSS
jgi:hypothetical protein